MNPAQAPLHRIVVVGGGASGLELATMLGNQWGRRRAGWRWRSPKARAEVVLVDPSRTHIWKPKLHEIAAGSMDMGIHEVDLLAQAHWHGFTSCLGALTGLDRKAREITIAPYVDEEGIQVTPERRLRYDTLVIAVGSQSNDFGTPGVAEHALKLETAGDARRFHRRMLSAFMRANTQAQALRPEQLHVAIIGAGATGVELAAELHRSTREVVAYGLDQLDAEKDIRVNLIEAAPRILPALPERLSEATEGLLTTLGVAVHTQARVAEVLAQGVRLDDGRLIAAELVVWAAGVKAPDFLRQLDGLQVNRINQLVVHQTLQTTMDEHIFAMGDCAACAWPDGSPGSTRLVPPRAQAAHQQAKHLERQIKRRMAGRALQNYHYRDFGSLVSLGHYSTVGNMMGGLIGGSLFIEGLFARLMYVSLYKMHEYALHGFAKVALDTLARFITRRTEPHIKLH